MDNRDETVPTRVPTRTERVEQAIVIPTVPLTLASVSITAATSERLLNGTLSKPVSGKPGIIFSVKSDPVSPKPDDKVVL